MTARPRTGVGLAMLTLVASVTGVAAAQEAGAAETAVARALFQEGMEAARAERWEVAHDRFARAHALVGRPRILVNLATAQVQTGRLVQAAESYRRFLREVTEGPDASFREGVARELAEVERRLAHLRLTIDGLAPDDRIELDGEELSQVVVGLPVPANPGSHRITVSRGDAQVSTEVTLAEGERRTLTLDASGLERANTPPDPARESASSADPLRTAPVAGSGDQPPSLWSSPWLWAGLGGAVLVGIVAIVLLANASGSSEDVGNFGTGRWTID